MKFPSLPAYHATLSDALNAVEIHMAAREIVPICPYDGIEYASHQWHNDLCNGGVAYNSSKDANFPIRIKDKATKKWGHVNVWRDERGRYEVNFYVL